MSDRQIPENVLNRVRKLLAVANDGRGNENEAANAAAMAQSIIAEYGLEMAQLADKPSDDPSAKRTKASHNRAAMYSYQRKLMEAIAAAYFCRYFINEEHAESFGKMRKVKRHVLLGRAINVQAATMVYDYLVDTMDRLLPWQGMEKRGKNALLWLDGCSDRLAERMKQKRIDMEAESKRKQQEEAMRSRHPGAAPGNALVLSDLYSNEDDLNEDFMQGLEPGTTAARRKEREARHAAYEAEMQAKQAALEAAGMDTKKAYYVARYGQDYYDKYIAVRETQAVAPVKPETEKQRQKREEREKRENDKFWAKYNRSNAKQYTKAYQMGVQTGTNISLDDQIKADKREQLA